MEVNCDPDDVRATDMNYACRLKATATHSYCDGALRWATGYHWYCICPCHPEPPKTGHNPGFPEAYEQWAKARAELERGGHGG